jgi:diguanylate cyclase (GGDEF)-like protein/PAS domain S-box-containing protein
MAQIIVERAEGSLIDRLQAYKVIIDGQVRGTARHSEIWAFNVAAGTHTVSFGIGYYRSVPIRVAVAIRTRLVCRPTAAHAFGLLGLLSPGSWIATREEDDVAAAETPYPSTLFIPARRPNDAPRSTKLSGASRSTERGAHDSLRLFDPRMDSVTRARRLLELDLQQAIAGRKLEIRYSPQIDLTTRRITAFEALLHWQHPVHGKIPAADFVPLAEGLGLICEVGQTVLEEACHEAAAWPADVSVAVNLKASQLTDGALPTIVASALRASGLPPHRLILEITQATASAGESTTDILQSLRASGVRVAIDDFGLANPSAVSLPAAPFDEIKIHRSIITGLGEARDRIAVVRSAIALCAERNIPCCAVGVETKDDLEILQREKCPQVQGHLFGSPLAGRDVPGLLARWSPHALGEGDAALVADIGFDQILDLTAQLVMVMTAQLSPPGPVIAYVNQALAWLSGYSAAELVGRSPTVLQAPETREATLEAIRTGFQTGRTVFEKIVGRAKNGNAYALDVQISALTNSNGVITHFVMLGQQVNSDSRHDEIMAESDYDAQTGILNGTALMRAIDAEICVAQARADAGSALQGPCIALINVDEYSRTSDNIADTLGGVLVRGLADRLENRMRRCDRFGRLGGTQFAVCMPNTSLRDAETLARGLQEAVGGELFPTPRGPAALKVSIGVASFVPGDTLPTLVQRAGTAFGATRQANRDRNLRVVGG